MKEIVFLVEGEAERCFLDTFLPRVLPKGISYRVIPFQGKQDMEKRMTMRIRGYLNPQARFLSCATRTVTLTVWHSSIPLLNRCIGTGREQHCLFVRIACTELETFYLVC